MLFLLLFAPYLMIVSRMMLTWAAGARCKWRAHLYNSVSLQRPWASTLPLSYPATLKDMFWLTRLYTMSIRFAVTRCFYCRSSSGTSTASESKCTDSGVSYYFYHLLPLLVKKFYFDIWYIVRDCSSSPWINHPSNALINY